MVLMRLVVLACLFLVAPSWATAQIFEWIDASGSHHYTNDREDIPEAQRDEARVVVRQRQPVEPGARGATVELASRPSVEADSSGGQTARDERLLDTDRSRIRRERQWRRRDYGDERRRDYGDAQNRSPEDAPRRQAQVVYDRSRESVLVPRPPPPAVVQDVHVNVSVPTTVVSQVVVATSSPGPYRYGPYDGYGPYDSYYGPAISTSFDRGRSRHRTVRMRLQEQFQYDRDGPYVYRPRRIPLGPVFSATLPRGLSRGRVASPSCSAMPRSQKIASPKLR